MGTKFKVDGLEFELPFTWPDIEWGLVVAIAMLGSFIGFIVWGIASAIESDSQTQRCEFSCEVQHDRDSRPWKACTAKCLLETKYGGEP